MSTEEIIILLVVIFLILGAIFMCFKGMIQTFRRNWVVALVLLIFAGPIWFLWAIIEMFLTLEPEDAARPFETNLKVNQNVNTQSTLQAPDHDLVACPLCAEMIKRKAVVCRFCGSKV
jgi:hypothetical protein